MTLPAAWAVQKLTSVCLRWAARLFHSVRPAAANICLHSCCRSVWRRTSLSWRSGCNVHLPSNLIIRFGNYAGERSRRGRNCHGTPLLRFAVDLLDNKSQYNKLYNTFTRNRKPTTNPQQIEVVEFWPIDPSWPHHAAEKITSACSICRWFGSW